ncbi:zinc/cadmium resistance protein [Coprinopsis cinerea okayama7|uniref:Zinc/cadmium resistance protein n=1 Tax=Coprinopsis cinerea (strain Okayama-7 / 130 / ATCC MYA-4618 / FGSC 9003) TaxID=240176 RepID=A8N1K9_COPC7|nr:zinc/cadmium resistance protein [Coprinopsis cinerea okayama7\|eukprot:XP_001828782.2 zinc/cadmium resistance protein [Coprinopsis cinerea okayama7\
MGGNQSPEFREAGGQQRPSPNRSDFCSVGYAVGSLALIADAFHMLNDVLSLIVALYAIKLTNANSIDSRYSYGWHRAEIVAALVNGVFLLALCFSISLEAIVRFFEEPEISNPKFIALVGSFGLASNLVGLLLFHEHVHPHSHDHKHDSKSPSPSSSREGSIRNSATGASKDGHSRPRPKPIRTHSGSQSPASQDDILYGHPAATRASLVQTANEIAAQSPPAPSHVPSLSQGRASIDSPATAGQQHGHNDSQIIYTTDNRTSVDEQSPLLATTPDVPTEARKRSHAHGHGSMNMRALVLHVIGDALGNVGVIATGLVIWLTDWSWKYYFDPVISLVITVIIFSSSMPLVRSASFILLQGVPPTVSLDEVKDAILAVDGVISLHELHVWQLSENKLVASVHVLASRNHDFMPIAAKIRKALHHLGIHSSTIQPEYRLPPNQLPEGTQKASPRAISISTSPLIHQSSTDF